MNRRLRKPLRLLFRDTTRMDVPAQHQPLWAARRALCVALAAALSGAAAWMYVPNAWAQSATPGVGSTAGKPPISATVNNRGGLPSLGDGTDLDIAAERRLGDSIAQQIYRDPDYLDDPVLGDYLQGLWAPLLAAARTRGDLPPDLSERLAWELMVSRDKRVNAFALPGGYMGVNLGLLAVTETPQELASVLAHELSHVSQRHIARLLTQQEKQAPLILGALILGVLAARDNIDVANAAIAGSQAAAVQSQLNFSRDMQHLGVTTPWGQVLPFASTAANLPQWHALFALSSQARCIT